MRIRSVSVHVSLVYNKGAGIVHEEWLIVACMAFRGIPRKGFWHLQLFRVVEHCTAADASKWDVYTRTMSITCRVPPPSC